MDLPVVGLAGRLATGLWLWSRTWDSSDKLVLFGELADELSTTGSLPNHQLPLALPVGFPNPWASEKEGRVEGLGCPLWFW